MDGYAAIATTGSPLDNGAGPVRWIVLYRGGSAYLFAGASKSSRGTIPEADGLFKSVAQEPSSAEARRISPRQAVPHPHQAGRRDHRPHGLCGRSAGREVPEGRALLDQRPVVPDKKLQPDALYKVVGDRIFPATPRALILDRAKSQLPRLPRNPQNHGRQSSSSPTWFPQKKTELPAQLQGRDRPRSSNSGSEQGVRRLAY